VPDLTLRGTFFKARERTYQHLPFEVPPGPRAMHVRYEYSDRISSDPFLSGGNTLDIGLFDTRGIAASSPGFRGWSGSHKLEFSVTETWATPPYLAGPLYPGTWYVLLGPYKVGPRGLEYEVDITFDADPGLPEVRSLSVDAQPPVLPAAEPGWLRGDLHCHTLHSDGDSWPTDMLADAVRRGLDFLGVTDHNQVGHHMDYARVRGAYLPILLPGVEVTTYHGHWNAWGTAEWWEFREPTEEATSRAMTAAAASGALVSINHPKPFGPAWEYANATGYHCVEAWNGPWSRRNEASLAWWEQQLRAGRRIPALGGSDTHRLKDGEHVGTPTTWAYVAADRTVGGVLNAVRTGQSFISHDVAGPQLYVSPGSDGVHARVVDAKHAALLLISADGVVATRAITSDDWQDTFSVPTARLYLRAQVVDAQAAVLALSNPVWQS
jgi:hypothetical protein